MKPKSADNEQKKDNEKGKSDGSEDATSQGPEDGVTKEDIVEMIVNMTLQPADDTRSDETKQANGVMA